MKSIAHDCFERSKDLITSTMAGVELGIGIFNFQLLSQSYQFVFRLLAVKYLVCQLCPVEIGVADDA